ncbi:MAG TPA: tyrosine-type recombinase/integrase [Thermoguttaceae bacterium]|nr:tyrosine-type recombinase/integrase [Phycisphaerae bacterium]HUT89461.1 tyrosine-type recombinase/integrase [Thermoguttaceae bacterium]
MPSHRRKRREKPAKPYPSFPLTAHNNGQWCKKIRGRIHFFGVWEDPQTALDSYFRQAADLHAGRQPRPSTLSADALTVKDVCNEYLTHQFRKVEAGEIGPRWLEDCRRVAECFAAFMGKSRLVEDIRPDDFQRFRRKLVREGLKAGGRGLGVDGLTRAITVVRGMLKYAYDTDLLDRPMKFGRAFDKPSASVKRKARRDAVLRNGKRLFSAAEVRAMIEKAGIPLKAMIFLGINGGFGNTDCARLSRRGVDLENQLVEFARPKTGIERVIPLWDETAQALRESLTQRPKPASREHEDLVFLTTFGRPWLRQRVDREVHEGNVRVVTVDAVRQEFHKLLKKLGVARKGVGFYALRHTFRTWADETKDQHAIHRIMGQEIPGMSGIYVETVGIDRLRAVTDHVHDWLYQ